MVEIYNFRYLMDMGIGGDLWKPYGQVYGHPHINDGLHVYTSTPVEFDEVNMIMTTASGRQYKICSFDGEQNKWIDQIKSDILNKGTEVY